MVGAKLGWKVVDAAFTVVLSIVTKRALVTLWKLGSGRKPPRHPNDAASSYVEVAAWAIASGAAAALTKRFASSRAERYWVNSTGTVPPGRHPDED